jgi:ribosome maturation factor RimP
MTTASADTAPAGAQDDRIVRESGTEARVATIVGPALAANDFRLVRIRLLGQNGLTLQVMAERLDGSMTIEDCEEASRVLSAVLDVEDPIDKAYHLEVSSPGIDRPLVRHADFVAAAGHLVKLETSVLVAGRKRFRGKVTAVGDADVTIEADKIAYGEEPTVVVPLDSIADARLVLTDDLVRDALRKDKKLRQDRKRRRKDGDEAEPVAEEDQE